MVNITAIRESGAGQTEFSYPDYEAYRDRLHSFDGVIAVSQQFERLIMTDTLLGGYRPSPKPFFTSVLDLAKNGKGTRYKAIAIHGDEAARKKHEEMGFHDGWGTVVTQMVEYIKTGRMQL